MLVSLNWLKEFVDIRISAQEVADLLTMGGIEVEGMTRFGPGLEKVVTALVKGVEPHPSADNLKIARVSVGDREESVVCGAPNLAVGQVAPYALPGAVLPSGLEVSERNIRGVSSPGMLCSEKELSLGDDQSGILVFDGDAPIGLPLTEAFPFIDDYVLEVSITPNRGDCLSILGIAREVAALTGVQWKRPEFELETGSEDIQSRMSIEIEDPDLCPRYVATMVEGITIGRSPLDVRLKLTRAGMRPISNVVDATNLILMECGQPLHAFDYTLLQDGKIVVRRCKPGERFVTLDGEERKLPESALMICDGRRSVALGGVMGGLNSEINDNTKSVLIESACFDSIGIRRTAKTLGMSTEASFRFERGVDPDNTFWAAHRTAYLISKLAGGTVLKGHIDVYPRPIVRRPVKVRPEKVNSLLGTRLEKREMVSCLERLGIEVGESDNGSITAMPPSWRWDLEREEDMSEEIARVFGFQNIPVTTPKYRSAPDRSRQDRNRLRRVGDLMDSAGFTEIVTMSFVSLEAAREFLGPQEKDKTLPLINPLTEDQTTMRTSLLPGLLSTMQRNVSFRSEDLRLYELGKVFLARSGEELPLEELRVGGLICGARHPQLWHFQRGEVDETGKVDRTMEVDFYDAKGALETLFEGMNALGAQYRPSTKEFLHPGKSADIYLGEDYLGFVGELAPAKIRERDLEKKAYIFEILLEPLFVRYRKKTAFEPIPRYPYIERDLSFIVEGKVSGDEIKHLISRLGRDIITSVILFDLYRGEAIQEGFQSMAFRIRYQSGERTLTDEEVQETHARVVETLVKNVGAKMRE